MWNNADQATKDRLEKEYQKNKESAAKEKAEYIAKYGKIEKKKKRKNKKEWFLILVDYFSIFLLFKQYLISPMQVHNFRLAQIP